MFARLSVTAPLEPPPDKPVPAVTDVISPTGKLVVTSVRVSVILPALICVTAAPTVIVAKEILLAGIAGATGEPAGVPATT